MLKMTPARGGGRKLADLPSSRDGKAEREDLFAIPNASNSSGHRRPDHAIFHDLEFWSFTANELRSLVLIEADIPNSNSNIGDFSGRFVPRVPAEGISAAVHA